MSYQVGNNNLFLSSASVGLTSFVMAAECNGTRNIYLQNTEALSVSFPAFKVTGLLWYHLIPVLKDKTENHRDKSKLSVKDNKPTELSFGWAPPPTAGWVLCQKVLSSSAFSPNTRVRTWVSTQSKVVIRVHGRQAVRWVTQTWQI